MTNELVDGRRYWCILPSDESRSYGEEYYRCPWLGEIRQNSHGAWVLHTVMSDGELDDDPNASITISSESELFDDERDAYVVYLQGILNEAFGMLESCQMRLTQAGEVITKLLS